MAIGTNDLIWKYGTQKTLEDNGASTVADAFSQADDFSLDSADTQDAPYADIVLAVQFASAPTKNLPIVLYARPLNLQSTNDAPIPDADYERHEIGMFLVDAVTTKQYLLLEKHPIIVEADYYIQNKTDQTISAGWDLYVTPATLGPAA